MSERTGLSKRGAKATQFPFSKLQDRLIIQWCEYLKDNIATIAGSAYVKSSKKLTEWKVAKSKELMNLREFADIDTSDKNTDAWRKAIVTRFTNYYHTHIRPNHTGSGEVSAQTDNCESTTNHKHDKLLRSFALLSTDLTGREFFAQENEEALLERTNDIYKARGCTIPKGAARNIALAELWDEFTSEEKNHWKERAELNAMDIPSNRQEFPFTIGAALRDLCKRGRLGTVIMSLNIAYRSDDNGLDSHCINIGFNAATGKKIPHNMDAAPEWSDMWRTHAESILPEVAPKKPSAVALSADGIPNFPTLDLGASSPAYVASVVEEYITKLWAKASPVDQGRSDVLWKNINDDPSFFYDTDVFRLPAKLCPASQSTNLPDLYKLVDYFYEQQRQGTPFKFTRRSELASDTEDDMPQNSFFKHKRSQILSEDEQSEDGKSDNEEDDTVPTSPKPCTGKDLQFEDSSIMGVTANSEQLIAPSPVNKDKISASGSSVGPTISSQPATPINHQGSAIAALSATGGEIPGQLEERDLVKNQEESAPTAKKSRRRRTKNMTAQLSTDCDEIPAPKRTLRARGPTGAAATPILPVKRFADTTENGQPVKKQKGWKGWVCK